MLVSQGRRLRRVYVAYFFSVQFSSASGLRGSLKADPDEWYNKGVLLKLILGAGPRCSTYFHSDLVYGTAPRLTLTVLQTFWTVRDFSPGLVMDQSRGWVCKVRFYDGVALAGSEQCGSPQRR